MELNGFQVERHGSGFAVSVRIHVGSEEEAGQLVNRFMDQFSLEVGNNEGDDGRSAEDGGDAVPGDKPARGRGNRRGAAKPGTSDEADASANDDAGADSDATEPAGGRKVRGRGRSRGAAKAPAGEVKGKGPTSGRGRRRGGQTSAAGKEAESQENPTEPATSAGSRSRTRRGTVQTAKSPSKGASIKDEELTKATSLAAAELGAGEVMDILTEFEVEHVGKLPQEKRQEYLDRLKEAREAVE